MKLAESTQVKNSYFDLEMEQIFEETWGNGFLQKRTVFINTFQHLAVQVNNYIRLVREKISENRN